VEVAAAHRSARWEDFLILPPGCRGQDGGGGSVEGQGESDRMDSTVIDVALFMICNGRWPER